jgi:hypothetical protein
MGIDSNRKSKKREQRISRPIGRQNRRSPLSSGHLNIQNRIGTALEPTFSEQLVDMMPSDWAFSDANGSGKSVNDDS